MGSGHIPGGTEFFKVAADREARPRPFEHQARRARIVQHRGQRLEQLVAQRRGKGIAARRVVERDRHLIRVAHDAQPRLTGIVPRVTAHSAGAPAAKFSARQQHRIGVALRLQREVERQYLRNAERTHRGLRGDGAATHRCFQPRQMVGPVPHRNMNPRRRRIRRDGQQNIERRGVDRRKDAVRI